ncbi:hypothetical protein QBC37DRAFT_449443 [Rhypophila decipiens]|uniref:Rhodopsin domain-containing protein n=1 Tax=Rhypophila decipiens TaxID=261697 RepID=A0AAN6XZJ9_9PEZI|nr:hypothetical protein QBC37DRAFT_449443 [Rhypophila decipiens]
MRMGPGLPAEVFLGVVWSMTALALVFLGIRLFARFHGPGRIYWDDVFVIFASALILITAALWQWATGVMYHVLHVAAGQEMPTADFFDTVRQWLLASFIVEIFFYTSLAAIKLSLLFFFRRLGESIDMVKYIWWPVLFFTLASWLSMIGDIQYKCLVGDLELAMLGWCDSAPAVKFTTDTLKANCVLDVVSDFLIMLLPVILLWGVQMRLRQKLIFIGLFSLTLITMTIAIVRVADVGKTKWDNGQYDPIYLWMWSAVEPCVATIVACLSAFPQLFVQSKKPAYKPSESFIQRLRARRTRTTTGVKRRPADDSLLYSTNFSNTCTATGDCSSFPVDHPIFGVNLGYVECKSTTTTGSEGQPSESTVSMPAIPGPLASRPHLSGSPAGQHGARNHDKFNRQYV